MAILDKIFTSDDFEEFVYGLSNRLGQTLPGNRSHLKMASNVRLEELKLNHDSANAKLSGVLILIYLKNGIIHTLLIQRQTYNGVHSGQVSFPGGRLEETDESLIDTALREAHEEVNIKPGDVKVLGTLTELYIPPSNFLVLPVIGYSLKRPNIIPEASEVAGIIETDLTFLFDPSCQKETVLDIRGYKIKAPYFAVEGHVVWGATAMILSELRDVIESMT